MLVCCIHCMQCVKAGMKIMSIFMEEGPETFSTSFRFQGALHLQNEGLCRSALGKDTAGESVSGRLSRQTVPTVIALLSLKPPALCGVKKKPPHSLFIIQHSTLC